jgi:sugar phosphate isomerase/epimerase
VCEQVLRQGSFADDVAVAKAAGVSTIGVDAAAVDATGAHEARCILDSEGMGASSYIALESILTMDGVAAPLDEAARRLEVAASLGAPGAVVLTGSLGGLAPAEADAICHDWLARAAVIAVEVGVRVMLEPIHPLMRHLSLVHTLEHGLSLVDGIEGAGIVLDFGHVWWEHGLDALIRDRVADIVSVQVTNVDAAALGESRYVRAPLSSGDVPVAALVRLLESAGYRGWYEEEVLVRSRRDQRLDLLRSSREWFEKQVGTGP